MTKTREACIEPRKVLFLDTYDLASAHEIVVYVLESGTNFFVYIRDNQGLNVAPIHGNQRFNASF